METEPVAKRPCVQSLTLFVRSVLICREESDVTTECSDSLVQTRTSRAGRIRRCPHRRPARGPAEVVERARLAPTRGGSGGERLPRCGRPALRRRGPAAFGDPVLLLGCNSLWTRHLRPSQSDPQGPQRRSGTEGWWRAESRNRSAEVSPATYCSLTSSHAGGPRSAGTPLARLKDRSPGERRPVGKSRRASVNPRVLFGDPSLARRPRHPFLPGLRRPVSLPARTSDLSAPDATLAIPTKRRVSAPPEMFRPSGAGPGPGGVHGNPVWAPLRVGEDPGEDKWFGESDNAINTPPSYLRPRRPPPLP